MMTTDKDIDEILQGYFTNLNDKVTPLNIATDEAKAKITKLIAQARLDELHRYAQRRTDSEIPYFEARLKELRLQGEE